MAISMCEKASCKQGHLEHSNCQSEPATGSELRRALDIPELQLRKCAQQKGDVIERVLSHGVFLAAHPLLGCRTLLRVRKTEHANREATILKYLSAERWSGAPRFLGMWTRQDLVCLRVEYIEGTTATDEFFGKGGDQAAISGFSRRLARLLKSLHAKGVVHLDVKPENIVIRPDSSLALIDWEHARFYADMDLLGACGTPNYVAPEVLVGKAKPHPSLDVWSYGVCVFVLATGTFPNFGAPSPLDHPFLSRSLLALLSVILHEDPRFRADLEHVCRVHFSLKAASWSTALLEEVRKPTPAARFQESRRSNSSEGEKLRMPARRSPVVGRVSLSGGLKCSTMPSITLAELKSKAGRSQSKPCMIDSRY